MLATNRHIYVKGLETEKEMKIKICKSVLAVSCHVSQLTSSSLADYQLTEDKCVELYQHMTAEAEKEDRVLKHVRQQSKLAKAGRGIQSKRGSEYQPFCTSVTYAKMALVCKQ